MIPSNSNLLIVLLAIFSFSCEEEFIPDIIEAEDQLVVEGYIEAGDRPTPPYVFLTRSFPFFSKLSQDDLNNAFVRDAEVTVYDGEQTVTLTELCLDDVPEEFREQAADLLGVSLDSLGFNFCVYLDLSLQMMGEEGKTYELTIKAGDETITATTTIPLAIPLDSLYFVPPPGEPNDTLAQLRVIVNDPPSTPNYYRYFTREGEGPYLRPFASVTDDLLFEGQTFELPLAKAEDLNTEFEQETYGLFRLGAAASIKWMTLDEDQFNFWNTLEFSRANQGPFSSYTRIQHNVEGGLGIWGGIAARYYDLTVEY
ncbi:MAG: DUF4249 domain-containing protein [Lewinella sp.]|mgnify:CR=1 FL=1|jgi:hypothetical protein|uniref:DUF4249 domain-containing protein n=1 Tax=Lewinella sp. TaxID=2004506 RepID=UPI003D6B45FF